MPLLLSILLLLTAFLTGSIPIGFLIARSRGIDIRKHGSGNIGATNVWRVCGRNAGLLCFLLDFLKGLAPSILVGLVINNRMPSPLPAALTPTTAGALWLAVALAAVLGHMYTPWLGFRGGKGISTAFGALVGIYPVFTFAALMALVVWGIALALTRMVGISSIIAAGALAFVVVGSHLAQIPSNHPATAVHACFAAMLLILLTYKHRANIVRTFNGTEPKIGRKNPT